MSQPRHLFIVISVCTKKVSETENRVSYLASYEFVPTDLDARELTEMRVREEFPHQDNWIVTHSVSLVPDEYVTAAADTLRGAPWNDPTP